jgi:hypothetical protein
MRPARQAAACKGAMLERPGASSNNDGPLTTTSASREIEGSAPALGQRPARGAVGARHGAGLVGHCGRDGSRSAVILYKSALCVSSHSKAPSCSSGEAIASR